MEINGFLSFGNPHIANFFRPIFFNQTYFHEYQTSRAIPKVSPSNIFHLNTLKLSNDRMHSFYHIWNFTCSFYSFWWNFFYLKNKHENMEKNEQNLANKKRQKRKENETDWVREKKPAKRENKLFLAERASFWLVFCFLWRSFSRSVVLVFSFFSHFFFFFFQSVFM